MPERDREVGLAGAGRAEQDDVLFAGQEVELAEVLDQRRLDRALEAEVELLERLAGGEAGGLDAPVAAVRLARVVLGLQQRLGEALVAPFLRAGALGELGQRARRGRRLQRAEQVRELAGGAHAIKRVVAGQRPRLDRRFGRFAAALAQRAGVLDRGDRAVASEHPRVPRGQLAGVEHDRGDLGLGDADLDAPARQAAGRASSRWCQSAGRDRPGPGSPSAGRDPGTPAAPPSPRARSAAGRPGARAASCACARWPWQTSASSWCW